ncbi:MAG: hypothetical protein ACR2IB_01645 [Pyrinomonadaceae bacterium]
MFWWLGPGSNWRQRTIDLDPVYSEVVTPEGFIHLYENERDEIESVRVIPGRLGSKYFGGFLVSRKRPVYMVLDDEDLALK